MVTEAQDFLEAVRPYRSVVVVTGAGLGVSVGLPTYRLPGETSWSLGGLERKMHARTYGMHLPELWRHWWSLIDAARATAPSPAHYALARWQRRLAADGGSLTLVTQNVDGLHQRAGAETVEFHGSLMITRSMRMRYTFPTPKHHDEHLSPPVDAQGSAKTRPEIVLFGERIAPAARKQAQAALERADLIVMIGTSGTVWPVATWPGAIRARGGHAFLVNPEPWGTFDRTWAGEADSILAEV